MDLLHFQQEKEYIMKKLFSILMIGISETFAISDEVSCAWVLDNFHIEYESAPALVLGNFEENKDKYSCFELKKTYNSRKYTRITAISPDSSTYLGLSFENEKHKVTIACYADKRKLTVDHIVHSGSNKLLGDTFIVMYKEQLVGKTSLNSPYLSYYIYPPPERIPVTVCDRWYKWYELTSLVYIGEIPLFKATIMSDLQQLDGGK